MARKKKKPEIPEEIDINVVMPRILILKNDEACLRSAERIVELLAQCCAAIISANRDASICMGIVNHVYETNGTLRVALATHTPHDVDHFRMTMIALSTAYEEIMGGHQIELVDPVDFSGFDVMRMEGEVETRPS